MGVSNSIILLRSIGRMQGGSCPFQPSGGFRYHPCVLLLLGVPWSLDCLLGFQVAGRAEQILLRVCVHAGAFQSLPEPTSDQPVIHSVWSTPGLLDPHLSTAGLPHGNCLPEVRWRFSPGNAFSWANLETWPPTATWCVCGLYSKLPCLPKDRSLGYSPKHNKEVPLDQNRKFWGTQHSY